MNNTAWILKISRPRFWSYLVGPWAVGMVIAASYFSDFKALLFWIGFLFFLWPANFFLYGLNDFADQDTDYFNPKKSTYEARYRNSQNKPLILVITMIGAMALLFMWILPTWSSKFVLMLWLLLASFYSLPPIRFKSRLFFDSFSNVLYILPGLIIFLVYQPPSEISWPILELHGYGRWACICFLRYLISLPIKTPKSKPLLFGLGLKAPLYLHCFILLRLLSCFPYPLSFGLA